MSYRVTAADRRRMARLSKDLAEIELDDVPTPEDLAGIIDTVNRDRAARGLSPLHEDEPPEEEFYRRARALGHRPNCG